MQLNHSLWRQDGVLASILKAVAHSVRTYFQVRKNTNKANMFMQIHVAIY